MPVFVPRTAWRLAMLCGALLSATAATAQPPNPQTRDPSRAPSVMCRTHECREGANGASMHRAPRLVPIGEGQGRPEAASVQSPPRIAIVIDDLGHSLGDGRRALRLPGPVACAILPHQLHSQALAAESRRQGKEVLLHLPMPGANGNDAGAGMIEPDMPPGELRAMVEYNLETVPHALGVNNHMGSELTRQPEPMRRVMQELARRRLFFLDSMTSPHSVAAREARAAGLPTLVRDVFLDNDRTPAAIEREFDRLLALARRRGTAIAIGHPYPETLAVLERRLPLLRAAGIELVPLSALLPLKPQTRDPSRAALGSVQSPNPQTRDPSRAALGSVQSPKPETGSR